MEQMSRRSADHRPADRPRRVADGGTTRESHALRGGGTLEVTDDDLVVTRDGESVQIDIDRIVEVSHASFDYFLSILSLALVGFGVVSLQRNVPVALLFVVAGAASMYRTYGRRGQLKFRVKGRAKPLIVYPVHAEAVYDGLEPYVAAD